MAAADYEDVIMKKAMQLFAEEGLRFLGISKRVKAIAATEIVVLDMKKMYMDYTFLMEDDTYTHFEFQTTDNKGKDDLRRFRAYEALLSHQTRKDVATYVLYTGDIVNPVTTLSTGFNQYVVQGISMADHDGDQVLADIGRQLETGAILSDQTLIALAFTPVMGGKLSKEQKITQAVHFSQKIANQQIRADIQSILFAFANKFLVGTSLSKIREELAMTELGQMLVDDGIKIGLEKGIQKGIQKGIEKGIQKNKIEVAIALLDVLDDDLIAAKTGLPLVEVQALRQQAQQVPE